MNWITRWKKIKIQVKQIFKKQPTGDEKSEWKNCPQCKKISYLPDLVSNFFICECTFHFDFPPKLRLDNLFDSEYQMIEAPDNINPDPLQFEVKEKYKYIDKIKKYRKTTGQKSAIVCALGSISNIETRLLEARLSSSDEHSSSAELSSEDSICLERFDLLLVLVSFSLKFERFSESLTFVASIR